MKRIILQKCGEMPLIQKAYGVSRQAVSAALNYKTHSKRADAIRSFALQKSGILLSSEVENPSDRNIHTFHDESRNVMIQTFGDHIKIEIDKETNIAVLFIGTEAQLKKENCSIDELIELQNHALETWRGEL